VTVERGVLRLQASADSQRWPLICFARAEIADAFQYEEAGAHFGKTRLEFRGFGASKHRQKISRMPEIDPAR
jgi:hypothetical protein